jgi:hypothetical protein
MLSNPEAFEPQNARRYTLPDMAIMAMLVVAASFVFVGWLVWFAGGHSAHRAWQGLRAWVAPTFNTLWGVEEGHIPAAYNKARTWALNYWPDPSRVYRSRVWDWLAIVLYAAIVVGALCAIAYVANHLGWGWISWLWSLLPVLGWVLAILVTAVLAVLAVAVVAVLAAALLLVLYVLGWALLLLALLAYVLLALLWDALVALWKSLQWVGWAVLALLGASALAAAGAFIIFSIIRHWSSFEDLLVGLLALAAFVAAIAWLSLRKWGRILLLAMLVALALLAYVMTALAVHSWFPHSWGHSLASNWHWAWIPGGIMALAVFAALVMALVWAWRKLRTHQWRRPSMRWSRWLLLPLAALLALALALAIIPNNGTAIHHAASPRHKQGHSSATVPALPPASSFLLHSATWSAKTEAYNQFGPLTVITVTAGTADGTKTATIDQFFTSPGQKCPNTRGNIRIGGIPCIAVVHGDIPQPGMVTILGWVAGNRSLLVALSTLAGPDELYIHFDNVGGFAEPAWSVVEQTPATGFSWPIAQIYHGVLVAQDGNMYALQGYNLSGGYIDEHTLNPAGNPLSGGVSIGGPYLVTPSFKMGFPY